MRVWVEYDKTADVWTLFHEQCEVDSAEAVRTWRTQLVAALEARAEGRIPLLIDLNGLSIDPSIADEYGQTAKAVASEYASVVARYGRPAGLTLSTIRLQSVIKGHAANLHKDRQSALAAVAKLRSSAATTT